MIEAFKKAVEQNKDRIYSMAYYSLGNREEAEDVTQEVLVRLWENWEDIAVERVTGWVVHVTRNACIDAIRKRQTYRRRITASGDGEIVERAASGWPGPDELAHASALRQQLQVAIQEIDEPYRSLIILREIEDMKYGEISEAMNMPLNTVKTYIHRGRKMLRGQLKETWKNEPKE